MFLNGCNEDKDKIEIDHFEFYSYNALYFTLE